MKELAYVIMKAERSHDLLQAASWRPRKASGSLKQSPKAENQGANEINPVEGRRRYKQ